MPNMLNTSDLLRNHAIIQVAESEPAPAQVAGPAPDSARASVQDLVAVVAEGDIYRSTSSFPFLVIESTA